MSKFFLNKKHRHEGVHWLTVSDLMSGLMIVFLFISIIYMRMVVVERDQIKNIIVSWEQTNEAVYNDLHAEFKDDLSKWNATIDKETLTVRFEEPEVLFERGEIALQNRFKNILADFFPRYISTLNQYADCASREGENKGCIEEVRIEGHTSSEWNLDSSDQEAYFQNMILSQGRTRAVLQYCYALPQVKQYDWMKSKIAAVGFSSAHPIFLEGTDREDKKRSRRVDFRVKTTVEKQLMKVIEVR